MVTGCGEQDCQRVRRPRDGLTKAVSVRACAYAGTSPSRETTCGRSPAQYITGSNTESYGAQPAMSLSSAQARFPTNARLPAGHAQADIGITERLLSSSRCLIRECGKRTLCIRRPHPPPRRIVVMDPPPEITHLLEEVEGGSEEALDELMRVVYADLERLADKHLRRQFGAGAAAITLEPAALVNESFMKLIRQRTRYDNRGQFFAVATRLMLRVLIDYRRRRDAAKRGGRSRIVLPLNERNIEGSDDRPSGIEVEDLVAALDDLEKLDARKANVVRMRIVWGMSSEEIAESLDVSVSTVERDWRFAQAWLASEAGADDSRA
jgi:RNA polymerase sigma-70 factor (ECF subfamily)